MIELYILNLEVNVCRLLMVRGINDSVRKYCHLLYRWDINSIVCKCSPLAKPVGNLHKKVIYTKEKVSYMEIKQGFSYHIKDEFFQLIKDKYLKSGI